MFLEDCFACGVVYGGEGGLQRINVQVAVRYCNSWKVVSVLALKVYGGMQV